MTPSQADAMMRWVEALINAKLARNSAGPHVADLHAALQEARAALQLEFNWELKG